MKTIKNFLVIVALLVSSVAMSQNVQSKSGERLKGPKAKNSIHKFEKGATSSAVILVEDKKSGPSAKNDKPGYSEDAKFGKTNNVKKEKMASPFYKNRKHFKNK